MSSVQNINQDSQNINNVYVFPLVYFQMFSNAISSVHGDWNRQNIKIFH